MFLQSGRAIAENIQSLINNELNQPVRFAVAFWGSGADYTLRGSSRIICDLESGACNPSVIRSLCQRDNCVVQKLSGLHAKVVISSAGAVVSSANMSTNGLGAEGADASGTIEAGYFISADSKEHDGIEAWYEELWRQATPITDQDLAKAQTLWEFRKQAPQAQEAQGDPGDAPKLEINSWALLNENIDAADRLRAVRPEVLHQLEKSLPEVERRRLGKIASWACHLILNQSGNVLDHSAGNGEPAGAATDEWIVGRFGTQKRDDTITHIVELLHAVQRDVFFSVDIRRASSLVLMAAPWDKA